MVSYKCNRLHNSYESPLWKSEGEIEMDSSEAIHPNKISVEAGITQFYIGKVTAMTTELPRVYFQCNVAQVLIHFISDSLIRIKLNPKGTVEEKTTDAIYKKEWSNIKIEMLEKPDQYIFTTNQLEVRVDKNPFRITIFDKTGNLLSQDESSRGLGWNEKREVFCYKSMKKDEKFYGFGEKAGFLNKRGTKQVMWNSDVYAPHNEETNALYQSIPFFTSFSSTGVYGIFLDNPARTEFDMSGEETYSFKAEAGELDYYFFYAPNLKQIVSQYTELTGRISLPPKWALGYQQSRYSYQTEDEVREVAQLMREKQIPCDVIYLDIHYMDEYRVFTWHPSRFPNGNGLLAELKEKGFRVVPIVDPGVKKDPRYRVYQEGLEHDYFCRSLEGELYTGEVWPGESAFPDFTEEAVRQWWGDLHQHYTDAGISGIWNDMNEPSVFNETKTMDLDVIHRNDGNPKTHKELHNLYGYYMSKATYEGLKKLLDGERPFVVTRAGYAGIQRYATVWTGDNRSFWEHIAMSIPMFLNMGMSGLPIVGSDIGGFAHPSNGPLLARWTQLGTFTPFCRNHSALDAPRQEPWVFGEEIEAICKKYIELRYRLMPHLYNLFHEAAQTGLPVLRPLVMEYPEDPTTFNLSDQLLVGDSILIAPVYRPDTEHRVVYLPAGKWVNYWTDEEVEGGRYIMVPTPLDTMPIFIKSGAILAEGPIEQYAGEKQGSDLLLHLYGVDGVTEYIFYEDDGRTFDYESGVYNELTIKAEKENQECEITYKYTKKEYESGRSKLLIIMHNIGQPTEVTSEQDIEWEYDGEKSLLRISLKDQYTEGKITIK